MVNVFYYITIKTLLMSSIKLKEYDKISHFYMCNRQEPNPTITTQTNPFLQAVSSRDLPTQSVKSVSGSTGDRNVFENSRQYEDTNDNDDNEIKPNVDNDRLYDHIDRGIGIKKKKLKTKNGKRLFLLTYVSPEIDTDEIRHADDNDYNANNDDDNQNDDENNKRTMNNSIDNTGVSDYNNKYQNTTKTENQEGRGRNDSKMDYIVDKDRIEDKAGNATSPSKSFHCSCAITSSNNFSIYILNKWRKHPEGVRLMFKPPVDNDIRSRRFDDIDIMTMFWDQRKTDTAMEWQQDSRNTEVIISVKDSRQQRLPFMMLLGVSGGNDLNVKCHREWVGDNEMVKLEKNKSVVFLPPIKTARNKENETFSSSTNPYFIGAISCLVVGLIIIVIGAGLWKRSLSLRKKFNLNQNTNQQPLNQPSTTPPTTHNNPDHHSQLDEEIYNFKNQSFNRNSSETKLGMPSLTSEQSPSQLNTNAEDSDTNTRSDFEGSSNTHEREDPTAPFLKQDPEP